jgi:catalase
LPINAPKVEVHSYNKDAQMTLTHAGAQPVYAPNSYGGPEADTALGKDLGWSVGTAELGRYAYEKHVDDDDFGQAGTLVRNVMSDTDREHLADNIVGHASDDVSEPVQRRVIAYWTNVDPDLGGRIATGLGRGDQPNNNAAAAIVAARANRA